MFLVEPKKNVVILQDWIMGLNQENLNNFGKSSYHRRRVFYSQNGISDELIQNNSIVPNFRLPLANIFPPPAGQACYNAHIRRFCGKYNAYLMKGLPIL